jgi:serpin B
MCVFMPNTRNGLWQLADKMVSNPNFLHQHVPNSGITVDDLQLPMFKLSFNMNMIGVLQELGLKEAFDIAKAQPSDMAEDGAA